MSSSAAKGREADRLYSPILRGIPYFFNVLLNMGRYFENAGKLTVTSHGLNPSRISFFTFFAIPSTSSSIDGYLKYPGFLLRAGPFSFFTVSTGLFARKYLYIPECSSTSAHTFPAVSISAVMISSSSGVGSKKPSITSVKP